MISSNNPYRLSKLAWDVLDEIGLKWNKLDAYLTGHHDRFLDRTIGVIRGRNIFHPFSYYSDGWGELETLQVFNSWLKTFETRQNTFLPRNIEIDLLSERIVSGIKYQEAIFKTSAYEISELLPKESLFARCLFISKVEQEENTNNPTVILLPGTGEHGYGRRACSAAIPLAIRSGINSVILESPFYGVRKPHNQVGSKLRKVSDLAVLGRATIEETCSLLKYLKEKRNVSNVAVAGISMGGLHSAMTASLYPSSIGVVSWVGPPSAAPVFTEGLLSQFCEWTALQKQCKGKHAKMMMKEVLDLTDINNFPAPVDPERSIFVIAENDLYVPPSSSRARWEEMRNSKWKGSRVEVIPAGHVSAALFRSENIRKCIENVLKVHSNDPFSTSSNRV